MSEYTAQREQLIEGAIQQVAPEYRDLVRRYFLLLARGEELK